ncbi:MAG: aminotransferase class V-fold PLP-dependent enzyme [Candidatus Rokuibacteriota bacterium]
MKIVILAAGTGRSLYPLTRERPKSLLEVNDVTLLERILAQAAVHALAPVIVVGYHKTKVLETLRRMQPPRLSSIEIVENPLFESTNTLYSLWMARTRCRGVDFVVADGDLICEDRVLADLLADPRPVALAVDRRRIMGDEEVKVVCGDGDRVVAIGKGVPPGSAHGEFIGLARYSAAAGDELFGHLESLVASGNEDGYYEDAIARLACSREVGALDVSGRKWVEIDFRADYLEALKVFGDADRLAEVSAMAPRPRHLLFCPGPVMVSRRVKAALATPEIGHREIEFSELLNRIRLKLGKVFGVRNFHRYTTVVVTGSGTAANEAVLGTWGVGRRLLVLTNGEFGERLLRLATHVGCAAQPMQLRWGRPLDVAAVEAAAAGGGVDGIAWVHHETSTGMLNPLAEIAGVARRHGLPTLVDAVSSVGGVPVDVEEHGITFCTGSANKAVASVPGLAFVCGRRDAFEALATARASSMYLDLYQHFCANDHLHQTPNTPAVPLFFALDAALDEVLAEGLERRFLRYQRLARRLRRGFRRLGLQPLIPSRLTAPLLTTVEVPTGFSAGDVHDRLRSAGYIVYPGKGILRDRVFQVANLGALTSRHVDGLLNALQRIIEDQRDETGADPRGRDGIAAPAPHR